MGILTDKTFYIWKSFRKRIQKVAQIARKAPSLLPTADKSYGTKWGIKWGETDLEETAAHQTKALWP
jgi:hypothetical protein